LKFSAVKQKNLKENKKIWGNFWVIPFFCINFRQNFIENINVLQNFIINMEDKIKEVRQLLGELIDAECSVLSDVQKESIIDATMNSFAAFISKAMYDGFKESITSNI
jgi:hypothetical protein